MAVIEYARRRGRVDSVNITRRRDRIVPLAIAVGTAAAGLAALWLLDAPRPVVAVAAALLSGVVTTTAVTLAWKISFHTAVAAGTVGVLTAIWGPPALAGVVVVAAIAWSRVALREHTRAQVAAGAVWGVLVMTAPYVALG